MRHEIRSLDPGVPDWLVRTYDASKLVQANVLGKVEADHCGTWSSEPHDATVTAG